MLCSGASLIAGALGDFRCKASHHLPRFEQRDGGLGQGVQLIAFPLESSRGWKSMTVNVPMA